MFERFKSQRFQDDQIGELRRSRGFWNGNLVVSPCGTFPFALTGNREAPDPAALALVKQLPSRFESLKPQIQAALFEHYEPYKQAVDSGEDTGSPCPSIAGPAAVWPHVCPAQIVITRFKGALIVEIAFRVAWDIEHTVGVRFEDWCFIELNGSV